MNRKRKVQRKKMTKNSGENDPEDWDNYMDFKKKKLMEQYDHDKALCTEQLSDIFKGVAIFVNGLTRPSAEELKILMTKHGGVFHTYQVSSTTHIIASNLPHAKLRKHLGSVPIVKPQWISESIDVKKLLDYRRYLLYTNQSITQPRLCFPVVQKTDSDATNIKSLDKEIEESKENTEKFTSLNGNNLKNDVKDELKRDSLNQKEKYYTEHGIEGFQFETSSLTRTEDAGPSKEHNDDSNDVQSDKEFDLFSFSPAIEENQEDYRKINNNNIPSAVSYESDEDIFADQSFIENIDENFSDDFSIKPNSASMNAPSISEELTKIEIKDTKLHEMDITKETGQCSAIKQNERKSNVAKTASDPTFLKEFYNHSRLHLISTLSAEFKQLVTELREKSNGTFPGKESLMQRKCSNPTTKGSHGPIIMHIDMDCFFVSVGLRKFPHLKNKPVAVTHGKSGYIQTNVDREAEFELRSEHSNREAAERFSALDVNASMSEVASCSYEARKYGIKNGMFLGTALRLCPELKTIPYDFQGYRNVSTTLYKTVASYTLDIEAVSCDEMYVDCTKILQETSLSVDDWATHIRKEIMDKTGCPCSTGFGANRLQARLATKKAKPAGQFHLKNEDIENYMQDILLSDIPGVGYATLAKLKNLGLTTCGDIQMASVNMLKSELGQKNGETLYQQARGIDNRPLNFNHQRKTVSTEVNYGIRFKTLEETYNFLKSLSQEVFDRVNAINMRAKCVTLKLLIRAANAPVQTAKYLGHGICDSVTKSTTLNNVLSSGDSIFREIKLIYDRLNVQFEDLRGIGIHLTKLEKNKAPKTTLMSFCRTKTVAIKDNITGLESAKCSVEGERNKAPGYKNGMKPIQNSILNNQTPALKLSAKEIIQPNRSNSEDETKPSTSKISHISPKPSTSYATSMDREILKQLPKETQREISKNENNRLLTNTIPSTSYAASIDLNVLNELPEEIRREVMEEYKIEHIPKEQMSEKNDSEIKTNGANGRRSYTDFEAPEAEKPQSPFHSIDWEEVKSVIRNWMNTEKEPNNIDTEMLGIFCKELAELRKIEYLKVLTSFLYRIFANKDCKWHKAYFTIVNIAQQGMVARYGSTLLVERAYNCCKIC